MEYPRTEIITGKRDFFKQLAFESQKGLILQLLQLCTYLPDQTDVVL